MKLITITRCLLLLSLSFFLLACEPKVLPSVEKEVEKKEVVITAPYGSWRSPLIAEDVYGLSDNVIELQSIGDALYFSESIGSWGGKVGVHRLENDGSITEVVSSEFDIGSRVHEYGGAPFLGIGKSLFVTKKSDQLFYRIAPHQSAKALTPNGTRHANCIPYSRGSRIICVREDHREEGEPKASLVAINLNVPGEGDTFISGHDFISAPAISPDNRKLAWITWEHPFMPWDETQLWQGELNQKGKLYNIKKISTPKGSINQPMYSASGELYFVADFNNWWNIYRLNGDKVENVYPMEAEFAIPEWRMGHHFYAFETPNSIIASVNQNGMASLIRITLDTKRVEPIAAKFGEISHVTRNKGQVFFIGAKVTPEKGIYKVKGRGVELVYSPELPKLDPRYVAKPEHISFTTDGGEVSHGYFYRPQNPTYVPLNGERPPLITMLHGGPTWKANLSYRADIQFWTSRGFAVLDLNYRGSSGFGRDYRQGLYGRWGIVEVQDVVNAANYLVEKGWVDPNKLGIRGGSASGLTVLLTLAQHDVYTAGVTYAAVSDLDQLNSDTHKFEHGYLEQLIGPYSDNRSDYFSRSPIHQLSGFVEPMLLFQGLKDPVVPPKQSEAIYNALKNKGIPTAYVTYEDEGHGFWSQKHRVESLNAELSFFTQVFGIQTQEELPFLIMENASSLPAQAVKY